MARHLVSVALLGNALACSTDPSSTELDDLRVSVTLEPTVVRQGDQFEVLVDFHNRSGQPIELFSGGTCPYWVSVYRDGVQRHEFQDLAYDCVLIVTRYPVPPRTLVRIRRRATASAPPGTYEVRVLFVMEPHLRNLAAELTVR